LGSSAAFHLAKAGKQVALLDKHALGSQTSPRAAGLTSQARGTDLMTQLAKRAVRKIEALVHRGRGAAVTLPVRLSDAIQVQRRPPSSHPKSALSRPQLASL
jgi:glycine/D-amino acid oxidase-like deaminating enzyme